MITNSLDASIYRATPLDWSGSIPIFSAADSYTENYKKIAADHLASITDTVSNPFIEDALWKTLEDSTRAMIDTYIPKSSTVLDVGVGLGRVLEPYKDLTRYGMDISLDYLEKAQQKDFNVCYARIEDMPYQDGVFDAAISCDVLEHVLDLHLCCQQIMRVIKPGGVLILRVPYKENLDVYLSEDLPYEFIHLRSFDVSSLRLMFQKIYGCEYLTHSLVAPYFNGSHALYLRSLEANDPFRKAIHKIKQPKAELNVLRHMMHYSQEEINNAFFVLRDKHPELYATIIPHLVQPLEVNIVFRKK